MLRQLAIPILAITLSMGLQSVNAAGDPPGADQPIAPAASDQASTPPDAGLNFGARIEAMRNDLDALLAAIKQKRQADLKTARLTAAEKAKARRVLPFVHRALVAVDRHTSRGTERVRFIEDIGQLHIDRRNLPVIIDNYKKCKRWVMNPSTLVNEQYSQSQRACSILQTRWRVAKQVQLKLSRLQTQCASDNPPSDRIIDDTTKRLSQLLDELSEGISRIKTTVTPTGGDAIKHGYCINEVGLSAPTRHVGLGTGDGKRLFQIKVSIPLEATRVFDAGAFYRRCLDSPVLFGVDPDVAILLVCDDFELVDSNGVRLRASSISASDINQFGLASMNGYVIAGELKARPQRFACTVHWEDYTKRRLIPPVNVVHMGSVIGTLSNERLSALNDTAAPMPRKGRTR